MKAIKYLSGLIVLFVVLCGKTSAQNDDEFMTFFDKFRAAIVESNIDSIYRYTNFPFYLKMKTVYEMDKNALQKVSPQILFSPAVKNCFGIAEFDRKTSRTTDEMEISTFLSRLNEDYILEVSIFLSDDQGRFDANYYYKRINGIFKFYKYVHPD